MITKALVKQRLEITPIWKMPNQIFLKPSTLKPNSNFKVKNKINFTFKNKILDDFSAPYIKHTIDACHFNVEKSKRKLHFTTLNYI